MAGTSLANGAALRAPGEGASGAKPQRARRRALESDSEYETDEEEDSSDDEVFQPLSS